MKLVWSRFAWSDRDDIFSYTEAESLRAAVHVNEQIADAARRLLDFLKRCDAGGRGDHGIRPALPRSAAGFPHGTRRMRGCHAPAGRSLGETRLAKGGMILFPSRIPRNPTPDSQKAHLGCNIERTFDLFPRSLDFAQFGQGS